MENICHTHYYGSIADGNGYYSVSYWGFFDKHGTPGELGLLFRLGYIKECGVFFCPSDIPGKIQYDRMVAYIAAKEATGATPDDNDITSSYMVRDAEDGIGSPIRLFKHSTWAIVADIFGYKSINTHKTGYNVLYADGGVKFYTDVARILATGNSTDDAIKQSWEDFTSGR